MAKRVVTNRVSNKTLY